jgi:hypothetical protein
VTVTKNTGVIELLSILDAHNLFLRENSASCPPATYAITTRKGATITAADELYTFLDLVNQVDESVRVNTEIVASQVSADTLNFFFGV